MKDKNLVGKLAYIFGSALASAVMIVSTAAVLLLSAKAICLLWTWLF